jgi:hypothetical protein
MIDTIKILLLTTIYAYNVPRFRATTALDIQQTLYERSTLYDRTP